ncbi:MAG: hypothetical protein E7347_05490 [Clostridiales bacterium]|nr:hypothetical protein [Clostridiales bacterium]
MQDKELEKILQEKADKIEMREFSEVWDKLKDKVAPERKEKKSIFKNKFFLAFVPSLLAICIILTPFLFFKPTPTPEEVFYSDELNLVSVTKQEAFDGLLNANITHVDLSGYVFYDTSLYYTEKMEVKGAYLEFYNENPSTFIAKMDLYDKSVDLNLDIEALYDTNCNVNSANVFYKFKSADSGFYEYSVYATHNNVKYVIEYSGITDNLMEFLTDFFA